MIDDLLQTSLQQVAAKHRLSWDQVDRILCRAVTRGLAPMVKVAKTIWKHREEILNASVLGISNALSESINSKVQWLKRQACGFWNRERFRMLIYLHLRRFPELLQLQLETRGPT